MSLDPLGDLGKVLILLSDVVFLRQVDQVYYRLGCEQEKRVDDLNLILELAEPQKYISHILQQGSLSDRTSSQHGLCRKFEVASTSWDYRAESSCSSNKIVLDGELLTSFGVQSPFRTSLPSFKNCNILSTSASSSFSFFISRLWPPLLVCFERFSRAFSTNSMSLTLSSSLMMSRSRVGLTSPST